MKKPISVKSYRNLLRYRQYLQQISHISFTFSKLNQNFPIETLNEDDAQQVIEEYEGLMRDTETIINNFNLNVKAYENSHSPH